MNVLCPFCQKPLTLSDSEAGKPVNCPLCQQQFAAPKLFTAPTVPPVAPEPPFTAPTPLPAPSVDPVPAPLPYSLEATAIPTPPVTPSPTPTPEPPPMREKLPFVYVEQQLSGYRNVRSIPLNPDVMRVLPAACFFLIFILSFFSWVGSYPGGHTAYTQNAWQCLSAGLSADRVAENELKIEQELRDLLKSNWWLLPYLGMLLPALALSCAGPLLTLTKPKLPPVLEKILQFRAPLIAILAVFTMIFLAAQWSRGFGLERAFEAKVTSKFADAKEKAKTPEADQLVEMQQGAALGSVSLHTTFALRLVFLLHFIAAFSVAAEAGLQLRGNKPPPRVGVMW